MDSSFSYQWYKSTTFSDRPANGVHVDLTVAVGIPVPIPARSPANRISAEIREYGVEFHQKMSDIDQQLKAMAERLARLAVRMELVSSPTGVLISESPIFAITISEQLNPEEALIAKEEVENEIPSSDLDKSISNLKFMKANRNLLGRLRSVWIQSDLRLSSLLTKMYLQIQSTSQKKK